MTHVWQFQRRHNVFIDGMKKQMDYYILGKDPYSYNLDTTKKLSDYNLEQQADIIADYYSAFNFQSVSGEQPCFSHSYKSNERHKYIKIMFDFLKDPKDVSSYLFISLILSSGLTLISCIPYGGDAVAIQGNVDVFLIKTIICAFNHK